MTVLGLKAVQDRLNRRIAQMHSYTLEGMIEAASIALSAAQAKVPIMEGHLRRSIFIDPPAGKTPPLGSKIEIVYGFSMPYSARIHENLRAGKTHGISPSGRKYKKWARKGEAFYLRNAIRRNMGKMLHTMAVTAGSKRKPMSASKVPKKRQKKG